MNAGPLTPAEFGAWRAVVTAAQCWLANPTAFHASRLERIGRQAFKHRMPPPWGAEPMRFWRDLASAARNLDADRLLAHIPEADRRLITLAAAKDQAAPHYLTD